MGIAYLAAVLEKADHELRLIDAAAQEYREEDVINEIRSFSPNLVGTSSTTASFSRAFAEEVKSQLDLAVIVGGPHGTALRDETMENPCFDIGVIEEGELTTREVADTLEHDGDLRKVNGPKFEEARSKCSIGSNCAR